jgi:xanthine dehydrogenase accessory factor
MTPEAPAWPMFGLADDMREALRRARGRGEAVALATIVALDGGGPRPVGAQMLIAPSEVSGFLSGGCLESDVIGHAESVLADGLARRLVYGLGSPWPDIRLMCGVGIDILLERAPPDDPAVGELLRLTDARRPAVWLSDGARRACAPLDAPPAPWPGAFARAFDPVPRLVVVGSDPTAIAIASLGQQAGFETTLVRPKGPAEPPPLMGVAYRRDDPGLALDAIGLDRWTAVAAASHEARIDHETLTAALPSPAFYVGALGARRRLEDRISSLRQAGVADSAIGRLRAPIGLDLGGKSPVEIALAVLAEIIALRHGQRPDARDYLSRSSHRMSTTSPAPAAGARGARLTRASARANTLTREES